MNSALFVDLGLVPFREAHAEQLRAIGLRREGILEQDLFLVVQHPPVFTLGRRGGRANLIVSEEELAAQGIEIIAVERGGDITYHGPGQLVVYPIIDLKHARISVTGHVHRLEEAMRATAAEFAVPAERDPRNHGVWVGDAKLGSLGVAIRHGVTFHGLALNVNVDLTPFTWINPCGLSGVRITSLAQELRGNLDEEKVKASLCRHLASVFDIQEVHWQLPSLEPGLP